MGNLLANRVAVVTGAGRGIGASVARLLAQEGAQVVVNDLGVALDGTSTDQTPAALVVEDIKKNGGDAVANNDDVADFDAAEAIIQQAITRNPTSGNGRSPCTGRSRRRACTGIRSMPTTFCERAESLPIKGRRMARTSSSWMLMS